MQALFPIAKLAQQLGHLLRDEYVARVAAIHHALRVVDATTRHVLLTGDVDVAVDYPAMDPHAQLYVGVIAQRTTDLNRAAHRSLGVAEEGQRHAVSGGAAAQLVGGLRGAKVVGAAHDQVELVQHLSLASRDTLGITDPIPEEDVCYFL